MSKDNYFVGLFQATLAKTLSVKKLSLVDIMSFFKAYVITSTEIILYFPNFKFNAANFR